MKWLTIILLFSVVTGYAQVFAPDTMYVQKTRLIPGKIRCIGGGRGGMCFHFFKIGKVSLPIVNLNVDKPTKYKGGIKHLQKALRDSILFTKKNDIRPKDISVYRVRLNIDSLGVVQTIDFVSGKAADLFYTQLITQLLKQQHWKPAIVDGKKVGYIMPLQVMLVPRKIKKTYKIKIAKPLKVKTVF